MIEISTNARMLLALSQLPGVGPATLKKLLALGRLDELSIEHIAARVPAVAKALVSPFAWEQAQEKAAGQINEACRYNARILCVCDAEYPQLLAATKDDPILIFVRGRLAPAPMNSVAIIGTREPTLHGKRIATRITQYFAEEQWSVVSGLAIGCDSIAHEAALEAKAHTVAVLAHGLQMIAPSRNRGLAERILDSGGALVSEYPFGREVQRQQYVKRDRTQAGMAQGVVMIQSDLSGGSLYASRAALEYGRWLAVPLPTSKDRERNEPKIQANLVIAGGVDDERAQLLRCPPSSLSSVILLASSDDYKWMKLGGESIAEMATRRQLQPAGPSLSPLADVVHAPDEDNQVNERKPIAEATLIAPTLGLESTATHSLERPAILQPPLDDFRSTCWEEVCSVSPTISVAVSARLAYLQVRLESVLKSLNEVAVSAAAGRLTALCFAIDDFVGQMMHAAEMIVAVQTPRAGSIGPQESGEADETILIAENLSSRLRSLVDSSTGRLICASDVHGLGHDGPAVKSTVLRAGPLEDGPVTVLPLVEKLCAEFNLLVDLVLYRDAAR